jgi:DNA-binding response OmpR family regulator
MNESVRGTSSIVLIEDDLGLAGEVRRGLLTRWSGCPPLIAVCADGKSGVRTVLQVMPRVVILDLNLPDCYGLELIPRMRHFVAGIQICVLSAAGTSDCRVAGLRSGADDYVSKPFCMEELALRVERLAGDREAPGESVLSCPDFYLHAPTRRIIRPDRYITLTEKECALLTCLMRCPDRVVSRANLLEEVWSGRSLFPNTVDVTVERLRCKLDRPYGSAYLKTAYRQGYYFDSRGYAGAALGI